MIDFAHLERYREDNRLEAKRAICGLPESIWETYSAFANTDGGLILLGVEENPDKSLFAVDLPDPSGLQQDLWSALNDPGRVSANILRDENVWEQSVGDRHILVIDVPKAGPEDRPVYVGGDELSGTYRRSGEGDYRCTPEEILRMKRK